MNFFFFVHWVSALELLQLVIPTWSLALGRLAGLEEFTSVVAFLVIVPNGSGTIVHDFAEDAANQEARFMGALERARWWRWAWPITHFVLELVHFRAAFGGSFTRNALQLSVVLEDVIQIGVECIDVHFVVLIDVCLVKDARDVALIVETERKRVIDRHNLKISAKGQAYWWQEIMVTM